MISMLRISKKILILTAISAILGGLYTYQNFSEAAFNPQIDYQAKVTDPTGVAVANGNYSVVFRLYTVATGGTHIWTETNTVTITNGLFSIMLGSSTSLTNINFNQTLYLGVNFNADGEMSPRKILGTVPAAFESDKIDGLSSEQFLRSDATNSTTTASNYVILNQSGAGHILDLQGSSNTLFSFLSSGNLGIGTTTPWARLSVAGASNGTMPLFTVSSSTASATTTVFHIDSNGFVGIGTAAPETLLEVSSNSTASILSTVYSTSNNPLLSGKRARGTSAVPTSVQAGDTLFSIAGRGYSGSSFSSSVARIRFLASENFSATNQGTYMLFETTANGATLPTERMRIDNAGNINIDSSQLYWDATNNRLGIGTTTPEAPYEQVTVSAGGANYITSYVDSANSLIAGRRARGTAITPTAVQSGDVLFSISGQGYNGSAFGSSLSRFLFVADENFTSSAQGSYIRWDTTPTGSVTPTERLRITSGGNVGIGTTTPGSLLSLGSLANFTTATSTFYSTGGLNLNNGCYAIGGTCIGGGLTGSGSSGQATFWTGASALSGDNDFFWDNTNKRLGVGTTSPYAKLSVVGETVAQYFTATSTTATSTINGVLAVGVQAPVATSLFHVGTSSPLFGVDKFSGKVAVGTTTNQTDHWRFTIQGGLCVTAGANCALGTGEVSGGITIDTGGGQAITGSVFDIAERYPASEDVEAAEIVAIDQNTSGKALVKKAKEDDLLVGVVSTAPAISINGSFLMLSPRPEANSHNPMVALAGRVPVKINLENGPIKKGDRVAASSVPGVGRRAKLGEQSVGFALEDWSGQDGEEGKVLVFVNLGQPRLKNVENGDYEPFDFEGAELVNVKAIRSAVENWEITEDGTLRVQKLCIGDTCLTEEELKALKDLIGAESSPPPPSDTPPPADEPPPADTPPADQPPAEAPEPPPLE